MLGGCGRGTGCICTIISTDASKHLTMLAARYGLSLDVDLDGKQRGARSCVLMVAPDKRLAAECGGKNGVDPMQYARMTNPQRCCKEASFEVSRKIGDLPEWTLGRPQMSQEHTPRSIASETSASTEKESPWLSMSRATCGSTIAHTEG